MRISADQLQERLEKQGLTFTVLALSQEGMFAEHDADWNYKDIPHLNEVHKLVEAVPAVIEDDLISNYFLQRLGPLRLPLSITNYSVSKNSQVYFTSAFFFVLVIETNWTSTGQNSTRVTTTYRIGSQRLLKPVHRLVVLLLKKNYKVLMSEDVPMRTQRGKLRARGIRFRGDEDGYSFLKTLNIHVNNVIFPPLTSAQEEIVVPISNVPEAPNRLLVGSDDHEGAQLARAAGRVFAFPRICPHEGASLEHSVVSTGSVPSLRCPWHGRQIIGQALETEFTSVGNSCRARLSGDCIRINEA